MVCLKGFECDMFALCNQNCHVAISLGFLLLHEMQVHTRKIVIRFQPACRIRYYELKRHYKNLFRKSFWKPFLFESREKHEIGLINSRLFYSHCTYFCQTVFSNSEPYIGVIPTRSSVRTIRTVSPRPCHLLSNF